MERDFADLDEPETETNVGSIRQIEKAVRAFNLSKGRSNERNPRKIALSAIERRSRIRPIEFGRYAF